MSPEGMITTKEASEIIGITIRGVVKLCKAGKLKAELFGRVYLVSEESAREYAANRPKPGPKVGSKRKQPSSPPSPDQP